MNVGDFSNSTDTLLCMSHAGTVANIRHKEGLQSQLIRMLLLGNLSLQPQRYNRAPVVLADANTVLVNEVVVN